MSVLVQVKFLPEVAPNTRSLVYQGPKTRVTECLSNGKAMPVPGAFFRNFFIKFVLGTRRRYRP